MALNSLVWLAYVSGPGKGSVTGGPKWISSDEFDINAKVVDDAYTAGWDKLSYRERLDRVRPMLRRLLAERFNLKIRTEMRPTPVYVLVQAKGGTRMKEVSPPEPVEGDPSEVAIRHMRDHPGQPIPGNITCSGSSCTAESVSMTSAVAQIAGSSRADRIVLDQTGLKGFYSFTFPQPHDDATAMADIEDALGLKFEPRTLPITTYIIDSAEKPGVDGAEAKPESAIILLARCASANPPAPPKSQSADPAQSSTSSAARFSLPS